MSASTCNMPPNAIDYDHIDEPIRDLIRKMNTKKWMVTIGSCAGRAAHPRSAFYIIVEVRGLDGILNLIEWLSRAHEAGCNMRWKKKTISDWRLFEAILEWPNRLHKDFSATGAVMGGNWFRFQLVLPEDTGPRPITRAATLGTIMALTAALRLVKS